MAIAFDSAGSAIFSAATIGTLSHTVTGSNTTLAVSVYDASTEVPGTITYAGSNLTKIISGAPFNSLSIWYMTAPSSGANDIVVKFGAARSFIVESISLTGVSQSSPIEGSAMGTVSSTSGSISITTISDNDWIIGALGLPSNSIGTGDVSLNVVDRSSIKGTSAGGGIGGVASTVGAVTPAGATKLRWTFPSLLTVLMTGAAFKPATGISLDGTAASAELNNVSAGTLSHTTGAGLSGGVLVMASETRNAGNLIPGTVTSATYAGSALTKVVLSTTQSSRYLGAELWYLIAPTAGANNLIVNYGGTPQVAKFGAITLSGVDQTNPVDTFTSGSSLSQGTPWTNTGTTIADNDWIVNSIYNAYDFALSVSNAETTAWNSSVNSAGDQAAAAYKGPLTPAGAYTTGYQGTGSLGDEYALVSVALRPTGGALPSSGIIIGRRLLLGVGS